jgi:hypothetical protein
MPALPTIANHFLASVQYNQGGLVMANVLCINDTSTTATSHDIAAHIETAWQATNTFKHFQHTSVHYTDIVVTKLDGVSLSVHYGTFAGGAGVAAGNALPAGTSVLYTLNTGSRGRSHRGRIYLGGVIDGVSRTDGTGPDGTGSPNILDAGTLFNASLISNNCNLAVLSRKLGTATDVTSVLGRSYWGSQRDRNFN